MRVRKFNLVLAVGSASMAFLFWSLGSNEPVSSTLPLAPANADGVNDGTNAASERTAVPQSEDDFSPDGKEVSVIPWSSFERQEEVPWEPILKKWVTGNRVFYQMVGPVNPKYADAPVSDKWGSFLAFEVFFRRDGINYDQWLIGPPQPVTFHYLGNEGYPLQLSVASLPASRTRMQIRGEEVTITFWCYRHDTPGNIVFNYNLPDNQLAWFSTARPQSTRLVPLPPLHNWMYWTNP